METITRRHAMVMVAAPATAGAPPAWAPAAPTFPARDYVDLWRRYGHLIRLTGSKRHPSICIYFDPDGEFPPAAELERFNTGAHADPAWKQAVVALLLLEQTEMAFA
jgi:hypothetical protein